MFDLSHFNLQHFIISIVVLVCSISLHEFGHAISADYLGDPGPRRDGRITLWPDKHFDPVGFTMLIVTSIAGFGMAWGKPVIVSDIPVFRELFADVPFYVQLGNSESWKQAFHSLIDQRAVEDPEQVRARRALAVRYSKKRMRDALIRSLEDIWHIAPKLRDHQGLE